MVLVMKSSGECALAPAIPDATLENQDSADMDKNGKLNVFDLCIMRRLIAEE